MKVRLQLHHRDMTHVFTLHIYFIQHDYSLSILLFKKKGLNNHEVDNDDVHYYVIEK